MPLLKHAKKKLKQDKKRTALNKKVKVTFKAAVKKAREIKSAKTVSEAFKAIDKAAKANLMHKNKAARIKSSLSKLIAGAKSSTKTTTKNVVEKTKPVVKTTAKTAKAKVKTVKKIVKKSSPKTSK